MKVSILDQVKALACAATVILVAGCATLQQQWTQAQKENTVQAYTAFSERYLGSAEASEAQERIAGILFKEAEVVNTLEAYRAFLSKYPSGRFSQTARTRADALAKDYLRKLKNIKVLVQEPFECADAMRVEDERYWMPLVSADKKVQNKEMLSKTISDVVHSAGYGDADPSARLIVRYEDQKQSGLSHVPGVGMRAFKKYEMTLRLLNEGGGGQELIAKTYQEDVEEAGVNVPFSFEKVLGPARKNAEDFIKALQR